MYQRQVRDLRSTLYCLACKRNGVWIPASLDLTFLEDANVSNEDGHLVNLLGDLGQRGYLPLGSYLESTKDWKVILSGLVQRNDRSWLWCTLDITTLDIKDSITLVDGVMIPTGNFTN
jgi:hypothetical protein